MIGIGNGKLRGNKYEDVQIDPVSRRHNKNTRQSKLGRYHSCDNKGRCFNPDNVRNGVRKNIRRLKGYLIGGTETLSTVPTSELTSRTRFDTEMKKHSNRIGTPLSLPKRGDQYAGFATTSLARKQKKSRNESKKQNRNTLNIHSKTNSNTRSRIRGKSPIICTEKVINIHRKNISKKLI